MSKYTPYLKMFQIIVTEFNQTHTSHHAPTFCMMWFWEI